MAEIFYVPVDMAKNEILNVVFQNLGSDPANPVVGQYYWNTVSNEFRIYTGLTLGWISGGLTATAFGSFINSLTALTNATVADGDLLTVADITASNEAKKITALELYTFFKGKYDLVYSTPGHTHTPTQAGLSNVTNDKQVKANATATSGAIPAWTSGTGDALSNGYTVETTLTGGATSLVRADAIKTYVDNAIVASDAMKFIGTIGAGGDVTIAAFNALTVYNCGWTYIVTEAGTIKGYACGIGDWLISKVDRSSGGINADWSHAQINAAGTVIGPASAVSGNFVSFSGVTGALVADSGYKPSDFAVAGHNHDTVYAKKGAATFGTNNVATYDIVHGLGTLDVNIEVYDIATGDTVRCGVKRTDINTVRLTFSPVSASFPTTNQFRAVIKG